MFLVPSLGSGPQVRPVQQALGPDKSEGAQDSFSFLQTREVVGVVAASVVLAEAAVVASEETHCSVTSSHRYSQW